MPTACVRMGTRCNGPRGSRRLVWHLSTEGAARVSHAHAHARGRACDPQVATHDALKLGAMCNLTAPVSSRHPQLHDTLPPPLGDAVWVNPRGSVGDRKLESRPVSHFLRVQALAGPACKTVLALPRPTAAPTAALALRRHHC